VDTPVVYFSITPSATVSFSSTPGFTLNLPSAALAGVSYYLAIYNPTQVPANWNLAAFGPASVSGSSLTFASSSSPLSLVGGVTYWFGLYYDLNPVMLGPTSLSFSTTGAAAAQPFTASQVGFSGPFTPDTCGTANIVSITPASGTTFTVTPNNYGSCTLTVTGAQGLSAQMQITVTLTSPVVLNPTSLSFLTTGATAAQTFTASQAGYSSSFTVNYGTCLGGSTNPVSVAPLQGTTFTVTPTTYGSCNLTVTGGNGISTQLPVTVTVTTGTGS
jgi:hypothetical protein